ncbi:hypothetical protein ANCCEY_07265 [Ancylostoma ceylanicum]|uniref:Uncharacterized protein n=1 Tax=Ancylostoma ceylanicum TaxID=53326 RepID=A0A0D6M168_9BILA|nr:hypothetical protein ANCCEY_07265 [Ancylostoma ceylanicum]
MVSKKEGDETCSAILSSAHQISEVLFRDHKSNAFTDYSGKREAWDQADYRLQRFDISKKQGRRLYQLVFIIYIDTESVHENANTNASQLKINVIATFGN